MSIYSKIVSVGGYVPPRCIQNSELESLLDTSDEWIRERSGVTQRYFVDEKTSTSDLAKEAVEIALKRASMTIDEIDMMIVATLSPDHEFPGTGCFLQAKLDAPEIPVLDIRQQCSGFLYGMSIADQFIKSGKHKNILIVGAEVHSKFLDMTPAGRAVSVLFGDAAGACIVRATESESACGIIDIDLSADGRGAKELWVPAPGSAMGAARIDKGMIDEGLHFPSMNGRAVFSKAIRKMTESMTRILERNNLKPDDIDLYFMHQANQRISDQVAHNLNVDPAKFYNTIAYYGNTTAATLPMGFNHALEAGKLEPGMLLASAVFGSGFTWGAGIYYWN